MNGLCTIAALLVAATGMGALADDAMVIVVGQRPGLVERFAAEELQSYLEKVCGARVPVRAERSEGKTNLIIASANAEEGLGADGFIIRSAGHDLLLLGGGPRGKLYAAYEFVEAHLGVRWFNSDASDEIVPKRSAQDVIGIIRKGINDKQVPSFAFREISQNLGGPDSLATLGKLRFNAVRCGYGMGSEKWKQAVLPQLRKRGMDLVMGSHDTYRRFLWPKKYFVEHPDWSIEYKRQRVGVDTLRGCATFCTTNQQALAVFLSNLAAHVKDKPEAKYLYPWPSDAAKWCECERCRKISVGDRLLALDMAIANAVKRVRPDVIVLHFAYGSHMEVPDKLRPPREMAVSFSAWGRDFAYALDEEGTSKHFRDALTGWSRICEQCGNPLYVHSKHTRLYGIGFVLMPLAVTPRDFQCLQRLGVDGFDFHRGSYGWWTKGLNDWVVAKLAWNCDADVDALIDDYFRTYWAPVGDEVKQAFLSVKQALPHRGYWKTRTNPNLFHTSLEREARGITQPDFRFGRDFLDKVTKYDERSVSVLSGSLDTIRRLRASASDPALAKRLGKLETVFEYVRLQRRAVRLFVSIRQKTDPIPTSATRNLERLGGVEAQLAALEQVEKQIAALCMKPNRRAGLLWDRGQTCLDPLKQWREIVAKRRSELEADRKLEPNIVWQIGYPYATFRRDMGSGTGHPAHVKCRIPDDWTLDRDASDFPQRHNEPSKRCACRYDILFKAHAGKHVLSVFHGTSAKPETVRVLFDGREIGRYTTQSGVRSVRADFPLEIERDGEHTVTLTEPDEQGKGYELDAIRLVRLPKP